MGVGGWGLPGSAGCQTENGVMPPEHIVWTEPPTRFVPVIFGAVILLGHFWAFQQL